MKVITLIISLLISASLMGQTTFGQGADCNDKTPISTILKSPENYKGKKVVIEGNIVNVCKKRGCWMTLTSDQKYQTMRIKVKDGVMVFPLSARGKKACVMGNLEHFELDEKHARKFLKHQAHEQGRKFDPASHQGTLTIYQVRAKGAVIN